MSTRRENKTRHCLEGHFILIHHSSPREKEKNLVEGIQYSKALRNEIYLEKESSFKFQLCEYRNGDNEEKAYLKNVF